MPDTGRAALLFLINTLFDLYIFVLIVRLVLVYVGANYFDPTTQFITKLTDFLIRPLRKIIPNYGRIEFSTLIVVIVLELIKFLAISSITFGLPNIVGLFILAFADALKLLIQTFFYAILLQAIMSWIQPYSPMNQMLYQFTSPIMRPFRRIIPPIGGIDISPIAALIILQLLIILLVNSLMSMGLRVAFG